MVLLFLYLFAPNNYLVIYVVPVVAIVRGGVFAVIIYYSFGVKFGRLSVPV